MVSFRYTRFTVRDVDVTGGEKPRNTELNCT